MLDYLFMLHWISGIQCYPNKYIYPRKEKPSKPQQVKTKRKLTEESPEISNPKEYTSWRQKEVIPRCQRENFAPTKFEIQIWVWNFGRGVEDSKIWRNGFPISKDHFYSDPTKWTADGRCYVFLNPPYHPWINSLLRLDTN